MPLQQLVEYFNQRFVEEQGLAEAPLKLNGKQVEGRITSRPPTTAGLCSCMSIHGMS